MPQPIPKIILFLAANPKNTSPLELTNEVAAIEETLLKSPYRDQFELKQRWKVSPRSMQQSIESLKPHIVHFSGHGVGEDGLVLENDAGDVQLVQAEALAQLFGLSVAPRTDPPVQCVLINACYSEVQANAIAEHVPYVIGMNKALGDKAALEFSVGFYHSLGSGKEIPDAYEAGKTSINMAGISEHLTPQLVTRKCFKTTEPMNESVAVVSRNLLATPTRSTVSPTTPPNPIAVALETPEGSVRLDSPFYIDRPLIERECYDTIDRPGALIRIKAPRQMGKSSLMQRVLNHSKKLNQKTACINFQVADEKSLNDIDSFLRWFCASVSDELGLEEQLEKYWKGVLGSKSKCTNYFQRYLLTTIPEPITITLGLDEVDQVFQHPNIAQEFFGLLRAWHEKGKNEPVWQKLRLIIVHSLEVYIPLNINQSPFNVGLPIELPELTAAQVTDLVQRHGLPWSDRETGQLMNIVDGHPYLVRKALYEIARGNLTLNEFAIAAPTEQGIFGGHLRRHLINLNADPELAAAMRSIITSEQAIRVDPTLAFKLRSMGLVELQGNDVRPLCNLYRTYFRDRFGV